MLYKYIADNDFWYFDNLIARKDDPIEIDGTVLSNDLRRVQLYNALSVIEQIKPLCSPVSLS